MFNAALKSSLLYSVMVFDSRLELRSCAYPVEPDKLSSLSRLLLGPWNLDLAFGDFKDFVIKSV